MPGCSGCAAGATTGRCVPTGPSSIVPPCQIVPSADRTPSATEACVTTAVQVGFLRRLSSFRRCCCSIAQITRPVIVCKRWSFAHMMHNHNPSKGYCAPSSGRTAFPAGTIVWKEHSPSRQAAPPYTAAMRQEIPGWAQLFRTLPVRRADHPGRQGRGATRLPRLTRPLVGETGAPAGRGAGQPGCPVSPDRWWGRQAPRQAGARGNPVAPYVRTMPHARGAQRRNEHGVSLGGPPPPWPSPAGGGNRAPPRREGRGATRLPHTFAPCPMRGAHNAAMNMGYLWEGRPLPGPPPLGEGTGRLPAGRGMGKPGFPVFSPQSIEGRAIYHVQWTHRS